MANKLIIHKNELNHIGLMRTITLTELTQILRVYLISWIISYALSQQVLDQLPEFPELSAINSIQSFTSYIESDIEDDKDLFIRTKWFFTGRRCLKPTITFIFEEIDTDQDGEYIEIYADNTFTINITRCTSISRQCGHMKTCLEKYPIPNIDTTDILEIGILNSAGIDALCYNPKRTIKAQLTITCGLENAVEYDSTKTFDLTDYNALNPPKTTYQYYTNHIFTDIGEHYWTWYDTSFSFIGTPCYEPTLYFWFEDADFGSTEKTEWLEIYTKKGANTNGTRCHGIIDNNCGTAIECLNDYKLYENAYIPYWLIPIGILKPPDVSDQYCGSTINATITLRCSVNMYNINHIIDVYGDNIYKLPLIQSTVAYDKNIKYNLHIKFINGSCLHPKLLSFNFQETDFEYNSQYLEIYTANNDKSISKCIGYDTVDQCKWNECMHNFDFGWLTPAQINELNLTIVKSSNIKSLHCGYTLNIEIIISCIENPTRAPSVNLNEPTIRPSLTYIPSGISTVFAPSQHPVIKETNSAPLKTQKRFDYMLILYGVVLVLFGIGIAICIMCIYKKCKQHRILIMIGDRKNNNGKRSEIKHNIQHEHYESLKLIKSQSEIEYDNRQVEGKEMELYKKKAIGEINTFVDNSTDEDSIEEMFVKRNSIQRQVTAGGDDDTSIQMTGGLPKITPQISLISLDDHESTGIYSNCQECGLIKEGRNDKSDGMFYCFECWRDFEQVEIAYD
eukprot:279439_1